MDFNNFLSLLLCSLCFSLAQAQESTARDLISRTKTTSSISSSSDSSTDSVGGFFLLGVILLGVLVQIFLFIFCYINTTRIKKKSDMLRAKIGNEYAKLRDEQYLNQERNSVLRLNYHLVDPCNENYKVWNGGNAINYQQPIGFVSGEGAQISNFNQVFYQ